MQKFQIEQFPVGAIIHLCFGPKIYIGKISTTVGAGLAKIGVILDN